MARVTKPLTNTEIDKAKPKDKEYSLADGNGLSLRIKPNGSKLWLFNYYHPITKKRNNISLGNYPTISLQQARIVREEYRALLAKDVDPSLYKEQQKQEKLNKSLNTFRSLAEKWRDDKANNIKPKTLYKYWSILELHILPNIQNLPVDEVIPRVIVPILKPLYISNKHETLRKCVKLINNILDYAVNNLFLIDSNPCTKVLTAFDNLEKGENPFILPDELPQLIKDINNSNADLLTRYALMWALLTMTRSIETAKARWEEIDLNKKLWTIPAERMKKKHDHIIPLSKQALILLKEIARFNKDDTYLFPSMRSKNGVIDQQSLNKALVNMGYKGRLTAHGMRKISSTYLNEIGVSPDVVEACLSHKVKGVRGVYNKATYLPEKRKALQKWGDYIDKCQAISLSSHLRIIA